MSEQLSILIFSESRESAGMYQTLASVFQAQILIKEKSKNNLALLMERAYNLVINEIQNPVLNEIEFVDLLSDSAPGVPILLVSSFFYDTKDIVFGRKIAGFILKPLTFDKLQSEVNGILHKKNEEPVEEIIEKQEVPQVDSVVSQNKRLSVLFEISKSINCIKDFDEMLHHIVEIAANSLDAERATLFILDKQKKELWSKSGIGIHQKEIRIPSDTGIAGEVALTNAYQIIDDPYAHPKFNRKIDQVTGYKTRNILCVPMSNIDGEVIGVFQILNKKEGSFTTDDAQFLSAMAVSTGIAIENSLLREELKNQLGKMKTSYDELYIAQNQIVKETKMVNTLELINKIKELLLDPRHFNDLINELKNVKNFQQVVEKINEFKRKNLLKLETAEKEIKKSI
ncbi:MAG: GAF domain-containing protein [Ignavibacteriaceae bacterium]|jgi:putative methionine-R-sulfoxide reductase with GAF domain|nr:GAF domain-containing protein [Ignavibacteriaceae bacterium]